MILPVSLSLVRALLVDIAGECFALPVTRVERVLEATTDDVQGVGGRQHIFLGEERVELVDASQVLELGTGHSAEGVFPLVILQGAQSKIGLVVDRFRGMRELSLQRLDSRLGRVQDVSATALLDNGDPVAVLDVNDLAITAANFSAGSRYKPVLSERSGRFATLRRVLVADDSLTVRELERKLLAGRGYAVETAVDGVDAWNALRQGAFDLLVTDIDMPRLDGIELVRLVRNDSRLRDLPVIVVSYKDREEDRVRGLEAGADFYLPKSSYQDESLIKAVLELIGEPQVS
jgi:two-component system sensor histidine kinase and response regulator WspE